MATHFTQEERRGEDGHDGERDHGLSDLEPDLVLEVFGMGEGGVVEDEEVREGSAHEIDDEAEEPTNLPNSTKRLESIVKRVSKGSHQCSPGNQI